METASVAAIRGVPSFSTPPHHGFHQGANQGYGPPRQGGPHGPFFNQRYNPNQARAVTQLVNHLGKIQENNKKKNQEGSSSTAKEEGVKAAKQDSYVDVICYNCGIPGHHKANCSKPRICFICKKSNMWWRNVQSRSRNTRVQSILGVLHLGWASTTLRYQKLRIN